MSNKVPVGPTSIGGRLQLWCTNDQPTSLRLEGSEAPIQPPPDPTELTIGAAPDCWLQLIDPKNCISRVHAKLRIANTGWTIQDVSRNGTTCNGIRLSPGSWHPLPPGTTVALGSLQLLVEGPRVAKLRELLARLIGWDERMQVDRALRELLSALVNGTPLVINGDEDWFYAVQRICKRAYGPDSRITAYTPKTNLAVLPKHDMLYVQMRAPNDADVITSNLAAGLPLPRLVLGAPPEAKTVAAVNARLESFQGFSWPAMSSRGTEIGRILYEWCRDVAEDIGAEPSSVPAELLKIAGRRSWLESYEDAEEVAQRFVRACEWGVTHAGRTLGIAHSTLIPWLQARDLHRLVKELND